DAMASPSRNGRGNPERPGPQLRVWPWDRIPDADSAARPRSAGCAYAAWRAAREDERTVPSCRSRRDPANRTRIDRSADHGCRSQRDRSGARQRRDQVIRAIRGLEEEQGFAEPITASLRNGLTGEGVL